MKRQHSHLCFCGGRKGLAHSRCFEASPVHIMDPSVAAGHSLALFGAQLKHKNCSKQSLFSTKENYRYIIEIEMFPTNYREPR